MQHLDAKPTDLERYIYLIGLVDRNETLFYRAVMSDPARFIPILYDPTVADACLAFGHIYRRARGMYVTREMKGRIAEVLGIGRSATCVSSASPPAGVSSASATSGQTAWASRSASCSSIRLAPRCPRLSLTSAARHRHDQCRASG